MMLPTLMMKCSEARILSDLIQHSPAQHFHHLRTDLQILIKMILIVLGEGSSVIDHMILILHCWDDGFKILLCFTTSWLNCSLMNTLNDIWTLIISNFPTTPRPALPASPRQQQQQQSTAGGESLGLSLDELRRELQQQQNNQLRSGAPVKGERVTIGLKSHAQPKHSPPLSSPTPAVPTPSLSSSSPFSENLQRSVSMKISWFD